jgi:uncharacterized protein
MADPMSPREVFHALVEGVSEGRWDDLPQLYASQTDVRHPFAPDGAAPVLRTREDIRAHFQQAATAPPGFRRRPANVRVHETKDPEVIVAEFEYEGTTATNEPFTIPCVFVLRVRDGEIVESRDYIDHIRGARARGRLQDLVAILHK